MSRGCNENYVKEEIARPSLLDRKTLIKEEKEGRNDSMERFPFVFSFHPALNELKNILGRLQNMLDASEEHRSSGLQTRPQS